MATESVLAKTQTDYFRSKENNEIWGLDQAPSSFVEVTLRSTSEGNSSLENKTPSYSSSSHFDNDKTDSNLFPAILDIKRASTAKASSFSLLSEGFFNENDSANLDRDASSDKISFSDGMSPANTLDDDSVGEKNGVIQLKVKPHRHKSTVKRKQGKSRKKSNKSPVLKRSQTTYQPSHPKPDGANEMKYSVQSHGNLTTNLNILTAQCKAVQIHQHLQPSNKITPVHSFFKSKQLSIIAKPKNLSQQTVSKSTNQIRDSQTHDGSSKRSCSSYSPVQLTRRSLSQAQSVYLQRVTKVFLSEKHSGVIREEGTEFPCAPPATPTPEQLKHYEYVPSLNDVRSQRAVRQKLQVMERKEQQKAEKRREEQARVDRLHQKDRESELRRRQRQEIYALNKIMTDLEHKKFLEFCKVKGITV